MRAVKVHRPEGGGFGPERKVAQIGTDLSPWYRVCTKEIFVPKGSYGYGETRNVFHLSVQKSNLLVRAAKITRLEGGGLGPERKGA